MSYFILYVLLMLSVYTILYCIVLYCIVLRVNLLFNLLFILADDS